MKIIKIKKSKYINILEDWLQFKKNDIKEQSYIKYQFLIEKYLHFELGNIDISSINSNTINEYFNQENISLLSLSTKKSLLYIIKSTLDYSLNQKIIKKPIDIDISFKKPKSKIVYFTKEEQAMLEEYLLRNNSLINIGILICLYTGIRLGEICGLKWTDIDFVNKSISINRTVLRIKNTDNNSNNKTKKIISSPKSESSLRTIPIPDFIIEQLLNHMLSEDAYVLTNTSEFKDTRVYEKNFENILKKIGIRILNFHALRHTFATRSIESGMDIKTLSEILGHSSYHTTLETYIHSSFNHKRDSINNLVKFLKLS